MEQKSIKPNPLLCMGLARLIGGILFLAVSLPIYYWLKNRWHLNLETFMDLKTIGWPAYKVIGIALAAGLVAMIVGQAIGASIKIYDDEVAVVITIYWHYIANGSIVWFMISLTPPAIYFWYDKELIKIFYENSGKNFPYWGFLFGALAGILIGLAMKFGGKKIRDSNSINQAWFLIKVAPYIITIIIAYIHYNIYGLPGYLVIVPAILFPYILVPISSYMWQKDMRRRG
ncbi:MAG: hypothetical protein WC875_01110 [Candidatus Absconditabacterales bacterium]|jgi:hypothetical protein